ncbi:MAG: helix-turn-helix transcriptional regulator [Acidimicrobiales bacterium]
MRSGSDPESGAAPADAGETDADHAAADARFASLVAAVTGAFGDPTRREIFLHVRSHPATSVSEVAAIFSLHPNVVRHHLHRLVAAGYLSVAMSRGGQAGRPAQRFSPVADDPVDGLLSKRDDLLVLLLRQALELLGPDDAETMAAKVGEDYGRMLATRMSPVEGQRSVRAAMRTIAETLTAHGFAAHVENHGAATAVVAEQCPFGDAASIPPVLCAVDRGMVKGLLAGLCGAPGAGPMPVVLSSRARGDDTCAATA